MMPRKTKRNREIVKKIKKGWSFEEVGDHYNLWKSTVHEIYHREIGSGLYTGKWEAKKKANKQ